MGFTNRCHAMWVTVQQDVGSLFKILAISSLVFLGACSTHGPTDKNIIVNSDKRAESIYELAFDVMQDIQWNLPPSSTKLHNHAIITALTRADNGERVEWIDSGYNAGGYTKVLVTAPSSGGWCRTTETSVTYNGRNKVWVYKACTRRGTDWEIKIEAVHG